VLQANHVRSTGAIVAAATTHPNRSAPAELDYRFSWVRDASFTVDAL
jgi:GH15 family glucan-1,4-alpha-glucosidase